MREELAKEKRSFKKVREKLKIETVQTSSRTSLRKVSREFFKSERKKKKDSPSSMEALALCTSLSTVFLNSFDSLIRICALNTSPNFGFPSNAIFSSAVRSSGCFISAATAIPASAKNRSHRLPDQIVSPNVRKILPLPNIWSKLVVENFKKFTECKENRFLRSRVYKLYKTQQTPILIRQSLTIYRLSPLERQFLIDTYYLHTYIYIYIS